MHPVSRLRVRLARRLPAQYVSAQRAYFGLPSGSPMSNTTTATTTTSDGWGLNRRTAALTFGIAFLLIGILGPIVAGQRGDLIVFGRNYLHDAVHVGSGLLGVAAALYDDGEYAREYLVGFGVVYLGVRVAGLFATEPMNQLMAIDAADNVLHLVLTVGLLGAGFALDR